MSVGRWAEELDAARASGRTVRPLSERVEDLTTADAYAIQAEGLGLRTGRGERIVGGKLGFTSKAMQQAMGVPSPNHGWLTDAMIVDGEVRMSELIHPKAEPEIAFRLCADLDDPTTTTTDVLAASEAVAACIEVVDSRFDDFEFGPLDNIADNSSAGLLVLGEWVEVPQTSLALVGAVFSADGDLVETASGAAALDDPAAAVAWMARAVAGSERPLIEGDIVISGGLTAPVTLRIGQTVSVEIDRIGSCEFTVRS